MGRFLYTYLFCVQYINLNNALSILTGTPETAVIGRDVNITLKCVVDVDNTNVEWRKGVSPVANIRIDSSGNCTGMPSETPYIFICDQKRKTYYMVIQQRNLSESDQLVEWRCERLFDTPSKPWSISIAVPVKTVTIEPLGTNNVISHVEGKEQKFNCTTDSSRPAASIQWYIGELNITDQAQQETPQEHDTLYISSSKLNYKVKGTDHNQHIYCEAFNIAEEAKVKSTEITMFIELPVKTVTLTPPGDNNVLRVLVGANDTFYCTTGLSRPFARIQWYIGKNNVTDQAQPLTPQIDGDKFKSTSRLVYQGEDADHNTNMYCEADNLKGVEKVKSTNKSIYILLPVRTLTITPSGDNNVIQVVEGVTQTFNCTTDSSRPAVSIRWYIGARNVTEQAQPQTPHTDDDKFISSSVLIYTGKNDDHNYKIYCEAVNIESKENIRSIETSIYIQIPVTTVTLTPLGYNNVVSVIEGETQTFNCTTDLSRPAVSIQWYIGARNVTDQAQPKTQLKDGDKFISSSGLVYTGHNDDHDNKIFCEAVNIKSGLKIQSIDTYINIEVPVEEVTIAPAGNNEMTGVVEGTTQTFNCTTGLGRPAASIQWYFGNQNVTSLAHPQTPQLDGDSFISSSSFVYTGKDADHNKYIYCEAINIVGRDKAKSIKIKINIQFGPKNITFYPDTKSYTVTEGKGLERINCTATCRPNCNFTWTGPNGYMRNHPHLYFVSILRNQSGIYSCKANNAFNFTVSQNINITVNYPPNVLLLNSSNGNIINESKAVTLNCDIDSHPLSDVIWVFIKNNTLLNTTRNTKQSNYTIQRTDCLQTGTYQCLAKNTIDNIVMNDSKNIDLYIQCSPRNDVRKPMEEKIIGIDDNGILNITVYIIAYPKPNITWTFANTETVQNVSVVSNNTFGIFEHVSTIQDLLTDQSDYGEYTIRVSNNIGKEFTRSFNVIPQRKPDPPANLSIDCDIVSMTVTWRSEFDGGNPQLFNVHWWNINTNTTIISDAIPDEGEGFYHVTTTTFLSPNSLYIVHVEASNGRGAMRSEGVNCTTDTLPTKEKSNSTTVGIVAGILGFVCALLVVTGVLIIVRRRRRQEEDKEPFKGSKDMKVEQDDDDGLKENPLYVTSGETRDADNGPLYSEVKKPKHGRAIDNKDETAIYSQVEKTVKKGKKKKQEKNTGKDREHGSQDKDIELGSVYENSEKLLKTKSHEEDANTYGNSADVSTKGQGYKPNKNKDGLIYADLDLKSDSSGRRFVIRGIENRNNYAILDLTKTAEPLPSDDSDDEKQISKLADVIDDTK